MPYTKTIWTNDSGEAIDETNLNKMEVGIKAGVEHAESTHAPSNADKTSENETPHTDIVVAPLGVLPTLDGSALTNVPVLLVDKTGNEPAHTAGQMYYADGAFKVQDGFPDVTLTVGKDMYRRVLNSTGATILKGKPCRRNGVVGGKVTIALAQADTFIHATILGLAAHDILDGEEGILFNMGDIVDMDTAGLPIGVPIFLSSTVPGGLTSTAPVIRTQVGGVKVVGSLDGILTIEILNNEPLPKTLGNLTMATAPTSIPDDLVNGTIISNWTDSIAILMQTDQVSGVITVPFDGTYKLGICLHSYFDNVGGDGKKELYVDLVNVTTDEVVRSVRGFILKGAETHSVSVNSIVNLEGTSEYRLEMRSELALSNFAFSCSSFFIESILY